MQYQYTATNTEGKQLNGVINTASEDEARTQLNNLGFSILSLQESQNTIETKADLTKYEFEAIDKNGKQVKGTLPAKTPFLAYKRLADEYHFTLQYLAATTASPEEKINMRQAGLEQLKNQYDLEKNQHPIEASAPLTEDPKFLAERDTLLREVDRILKEVNTLLARFETKISPEKRAEIAGIIDKLGRIKSSNNLEYIRHTSKELLKKVQEDEIFLAEQDHDEERHAILQESQRMMLELGQKSAAQVDVGVQIKESLSNVEKKLKGTSFEFLLHPLNGIKAWFTDPPEVERLKTQQSVLRSQQWQAFKMALKTPKTLRQSAWENVRDISIQKKEIRKSLHDLKHRRDNSHLLIKKEKHVFFLEELNSFTGWLLFFYLLYYFVGHYVTTRGLPLRPLLGIPFDMGESVLFKYLLAFAFILHAGLSLKLNFFLRNKTASMVLVSSVLAASLLILFNV